MKWVRSSCVLTLAGIEADTYTYNLILRHCFNSQRKATLEKYYHEMKAKSISLNTHTFNYVMSSVYDKQSAVIQYFHEMKELKVKPDIHIYNKVLYVSDNNPYTFGQYLKEMQVDTTW